MTPAEKKPSNIKTILPATLEDLESTRSDGGGGSDETQPTDGQQSAKIHLIE